MRSIFLLALAAMSLNASAAFIELGASANYRSSGYDANNKIESLSYTATFSYYFWEMCAWEVNYTTGYSKQVTKGTGPLDDKETVEDNIDLASADLVLSFAGRQDPFRPYIKLGGGYLMKERFRQVNEDDKTRISHQAGLVPSGGFGLAVGLTKELSIKMGLEAWSSPKSKDQPTIVDCAGRAGISWMF